MSHRVGIDVGGTFTDFVIVDPEGRSKLFKTLTTTPPTEGVIAGLEQLAADQDTSLEALLGDVTQIVHGTTITTNAVLTHTGARTVFLTTEGFRDVLQMRRGIKEGNQYDYSEPQPEPLVPRSMVFEVAERVNARNEVLTPLPEGQIREIAASIKESEEPVEAVAVSYMWSFNAPEHERRTAQILEEALPGVSVSLSSEVLPQIRLYERNSTTVLNAYVAPVLQRYLAELEQRLAGAGFGGTLLIMQSNGGLMKPEVSARFAVNTLLSGPAGGPEAGIAYAGLHDRDDLITIDMGGTSFDVALIEGGHPVTTTEGAVGGHRVAAPALDIHTIGAGGGSIAHIDDGGLIAVGPQSAGSDPGPVSYGRGGEEPTVTDADLVLGYLDPAAFAGGRMTLDAKAAEKAIEEQIADPLGLSTDEAAAGIYTLVNSNMASAVRFISVERGKDPREFALVVAGGAGPLHAGAIAVELGIPLVVVPRESAVFCAAGMVISNIKHDYVQTFTRPIGEETVREANEILVKMIDQARLTLAGEGVAEGDVAIRVGADVQYIGQFNEVDVMFDGERLDAESLAASFHARHNDLFGHSVPGAPVELMNLRVRSEGVTEKPRFDEQPDTGTESSHALKGQRSAWFDGARRSADVYDGLALTHGNRVPGPAIVELPTTTIVVPASIALGCDRYENYILHPSDLDAAEALQQAPERETVTVGGRS